MSVKKEEIRENKPLRLVIKIGRHVFPSDLDSKIISVYAELFCKLRAEGHRIVVVTGGGGEARRYISIVRELGGSEFACDLLGIDVSRINAKLLITKLGDEAFPEPPSSLGELRKAFDGGKIIVIGGLQPGQSTNAVAALAAEAIRADLFINTTDVEGVYTANPKVDINAKKLDVIETDELLKQSLMGELHAGSYELFDPIAIKIVERSQIPTRIINGLKPENVIRVVKGEAVGTLVKPS
ncbi:MAG: uridylate kinase [Thermoproteota archaeon]|nr:uridylate kinase [Thermoproteota archaeon]